MDVEPVADKLGNHLVGLEHGADDGAALVRAVVHPHVVGARVADADRLAAVGVEDDHVGVRADGDGALPREQAEHLGRRGRGPLVLAVLAAAVFLLYNSLVSKRNTVDNAFASVDVYLKQRFDLIPNLGPVLAWIPAVIFALMFGSTRFVEMDPLVFALIVSAGYLLLSGLENQILVPRIMGNAVNLPPLVVLIGVIVGGSTLGIAGIFLAVPMMATGKEVFLYLYGKVLETEGDLPQPESKEEGNQSFREFLKSTTPKLMRGGALVYIVPHALLRDLPLFATSVLWVLLTAAFFRRRIGVAMALEMR